MINTLWCLCEITLVIHSDSVGYYWNKICLASSGVTTLPIIEEKLPPLTCPNIGNERQIKVLFACIEIIKF